MWSYSVLFCAQSSKSYVAGSVPNCKYTNIRKAVYTRMIIFQTECLEKKAGKDVSWGKNFMFKKYLRNLT